MVRGSDLLRASNKITTYIQKLVLRAGIESREEVLELFDNMYKVFPHWVIASCPAMHPDINYVSKNAPFTFGYDREYILRNSKLELFFKHVHEADQEDLYKCISFAHDHLASMGLDDHPRQRFVFHYRFQKANGQYIYLLDEKATAKLSDGNNLYYVLFRDISEEKPFKGVKVEFFEEDEIMRKVKEFKPSAEGINLSKREQELVSLIKQGLSTKEIAWHLSISHNTVRNIKSKLFEKYNVSNSIELLNMTGELLANGCICKSFIS